MDRFYHGVETALVALGFALTLAAFALLAEPPQPLPYGVTLPMLTVTAVDAG